MVLDRQQKITEILAEAHRKDVEQANAFDFPEWRKILEEGFDTADQYGEHYNKLHVGLFCPPLIPYHANKNEIVRYLEDRVSSGPNEHVALDAVKIHLKTFGAPWK